METRLWWMTGRKAIIRRYLALAMGEHESCRIMDVGCGSGENLGVLAEYGEVFGMEPSSVLAGRARARGIAQAIYEEDASTLPAVKSMNLFTMFDVLEHIEDDRGFLTSLAHEARQAHHLLVSVPACPRLYGEHDRLLHHYRRYNRTMLRTTLEAGGYQLLHMSYHMTILFPLALAVRLKDKACGFFGFTRNKVELGDVPPPLSTILAGLLSMESRVVGRLPLPFGLWLFALARRRL